jgi:hypothetical protein
MFKLDPAHVAAIVLTVIGILGPYAVHAIPSAAAAEAVNVLAAVASVLGAVVALLKQSIVAAPPAFAPPSATVSTTILPPAPEAEKAPQ